ncbi:hypothetical protein [Clostridium tagluense]|uniref:hypothetical protein n=1 Tax=Clostridium tagluense TaxID=360422 RepID=UPI001C0BF08B|nr:hypothetical protein [Clostridium tagluense]MBU3126777.1 hypothetical protein [Clostridium tagluense]
MIVKIKCRQCGEKRTIRRATLKDARKTKRLFKNKCICGKCTFKVMANKAAKEIVRGVTRA